MQPRRWLAGVAAPATTATCDAVGASGDNATGGEMRRVRRELPTLRLKVFSLPRNNFSPRARPTPSRAAAFNLFVCNYRSLLDPLYVSAAFSRANLAAATYIISRLSEILAPIRTFHLTRDHAADRAAM
ncbi:hypothetical protein E2562_033394 [Oryza meyeriana var. granulata]|uniref:Uncharacterized protein n=1 Tax=Oryza meyeriana var. granulata TaxID=110450 RepID=A0A6G1C158_9ORYZ|nr:hypothetical protein E2562_033394 [Oryza meyeriana var. granulata]